MAKNKPYGDNARKGAVKNRTQVQNPKTGLWVKRDSDTGRFMDVKTSSDKPFKGVTKERKRSEFNHFFFIKYLSNTSNTFDCFSFNSL